MDARAHEPEDLINVGLLWFHAVELLRATLFPCFLAGSHKQSRSGFCGFCLLSSHGTASRHGTASASQHGHMIPPRAPRNRLANLPGFTLHLYSPYLTPSTHGIAWTRSGRGGRLVVRHTAPVHVGGNLYLQIGTGLDMVQRWEAICSSCILRRSISGI